MRETDAIIEKVRRVNDTHQHVYLTVDGSLSGLLPGQSVLARMGDSFDPYLREQWFPVGIGDNRLVVERPQAFHYDPGQIVSLLGIVGQPFRFRKTLRNVLLVAYQTEPTPLLMMIPSLLASQAAVTLALLGNAAEYGTSHLPSEVEVLHGDDELKWENRVTTVGWADQVFVTVAQANELMNFRAVWDMFHELRADIPKNHLFGVFHPLLPCGLGACGACLVRLKDSPAPVCTQGPAFDLTEVILP
jgi:hypothetical protein